MSFYRIIIWFYRIVNGLLNCIRIFFAAHTLCKNPESATDGKVGMSTTNCVRSTDRLPHSNNIVQRHRSCQITRQGSNSNRSSSFIRQHQSSFTATQVLPSWSNSTQIFITSNDHIMKNIYFTVYLMIPM